ncbi:MAG: hypothetical protein WKF58_18965 [Ilumatobacteraceae bacterium]
MKKAQLLTRVGSFAVRRRRLVLALTALFMVVAGVLGTRAFGVLQDEGLRGPRLGEPHADELVGERFGGGESDIVIVATAAGGDVDAPRRSRGRYDGQRPDRSVRRRRQRSRRTGRRIRRRRCAVRVATPRSCSSTPKKALPRTCSVSQKISPTHPRSRDQR